MTAVDVASDQGYMTTKLAFEFLLAGGANIIGTVKRAPCWPFTFDQHLKEHDKQSCVDTKGSPSLFLKTTKIRQSGKTITASAFRNGSESVSNTISSIHHGHHWKGMALYPMQDIEYSKDKKA